MIFNYKNDKGITLIALVITIIITIIIAAIAVTSGLDTERKARYFESVAELKTMQTEVNLMYQKYKDGDSDYLEKGSAISASLKTADNENVQELSTAAFNDLKVANENRTKYRYFSSSYLKNEMKIEGIKDDFLVDVQDRDVILLQGVDYKGTIYYSLSQVENSTYNVEYTGDGIEPISNEPNSDVVNIEVPKVSGQEMIPIVWDSRKLAWVKADVRWNETLARWEQASNSYYKWYDYSKNEKRWANVATVVENGRNTRDYYKQASSGTEILMDDISSMYVWIPRFASKKTHYTDETYATEVKTQTNFINTDIKFLNSSEAAPTGYTIASEGFWIAKFEASNFTSTTPESNTKTKYGGPRTNDTIAEPANALEDYIKIKPNLTSWRNLPIEHNTEENVKHIVETINEDQENVYGLSSRSETGLVTTSMWEAVGDLAQSEYGNKVGNSNQTVYGNFFYQGDGTVSECNYTTQTGVVATVNGNDYSGITDITKLVTTKRTENSGTIIINDSFNYYQYWTENGKKGTTSSNIYGIYDMIGGAKEYAVNTVGNTDHYYTMSGNFAETGENATYYYKSAEINNMSSKDKSVGFRTCITVGNESSIVNALVDDCGTRSTIYLYGNLKSDNVSQGDTITIYQPNSNTELKTITVGASSTEISNESEYATYTVAQNGKYTFKVKKGSTESYFSVRVKNVEKFKLIDDLNLAYSNTEQKAYNYKGAAVPKGYYVDTKTNVDTGLVITDEIDSNGYSIGNEWVWVPVNSDVGNNDINVIESGNMLGAPSVSYTQYAKLYSFSHARTRDAYGTFYAIGISSNSTLGNPSDTSGFREPSLLTDDTYGDEVYITSIAKRDGTGNFTSGQIANVANQYVIDYNSMVTSVERYGGFYIGRYELANISGTAKEQPGTSYMSGNWFSLYNKCLKLSKDGTATETSMIYGSFWDATMQWLSNKFDVGLTEKASSGYGVFETEAVTVSKNRVTIEVKSINVKKNLTTGQTSYTKSNNIYDLSGNGSEWTQEAYNGNNRIMRGGCYVDSNRFGTYTARRYNSVPTVTNIFNTSRPQLYIK